MTDYKSIKSFSPDQKKYYNYVCDEMKRRGYSAKEIPIIISNTGFIKALTRFPEEQMHYDPYDAVNEIIYVAAKTKTRKQE